MFDDSSRFARGAFLAALALCAAAPAALSAEGERETVVILHGMGRTRASMAVLAARFQAAGFETLSFPYGTAASTLEETSAALAVYLEKRVKTERYHFVAHSLGNIIIRNALRGKLRPGLGRIVMLAPPNQPARLAKLLKENPVFRWRTGDSGQKLSEEEFYKTLPTPPVEFGVIAGDKGQKLTFEGPNDGIVEVEGTKLAGMKDFVLVHHTHTFMMNAKDTFSLCRRFLESGSF